MVKLTNVNQHGMAVLRRSKICMDTLNMRSTGLSSNKVYHKLDFMVSGEVERICLMKNKNVNEP